MTPLSERDFQRQVVELAELYGWEWMHPRAGRTVDSWRTPMSGTMAQGWPDLVLLHVERRRLLFVELKADAGKLTAHQERVIEVLQRAGLPRYNADFLSWNVHVWRPKDWPFIEATLQSKKAEAA